jgi:outer membrane immunogenic protein
MENTMRPLCKATISLALIAALGYAPFAAADWTGGYVGVYAGSQMDPDDDDDRILFDTDLDGSFGDTVRTGAGADAFSPGFCDGVAQGPTPGAGCAENTGGGDWGLRAGYDWDTGNFVYGVLLEYGYNDARDAVAAFSTTPARYTMLRKVDDTLALRARAGFTFGDGGNLVYATAGYARASIDNFFATSNGVNTFVSSGGGDADGYQYGLGIERRFWDRVSLGLEYLHTSLDDDETRVRAQGPAPTTNPFILVNAAGTDFRRSDEDFDLDSVRLTLSYRF